MATTSALARIPFAPTSSEWSNFTIIQKKSRAQRNQERNVEKNERKSTKSTTKDTSKSTTQNTRVTTEINKYGEHPNEDYI